MQQYKSHKVVHATPMSRGEFVKKITDKDPSRSADLTHGNADDEGYFVIYSKDTKDHYESWSPKAVFDEGYSVI